METVSVPPRLSLMLGVCRAMHALGVWVGLPAMVLLVSVDVVLRYFFASAIIWSQEINTLLLLVVLSAGLPLATATRRHIRMELFYERMARPAQIAVDLLTAAIGVAVAGMLAWQSVSDVREAVRYGDRADFIPVPLWPFHAVFGIAALLTALAFLAAPFVRVQRPLEDAPT
ncbi:MAG: TRAP transporter small permease [Azospirillaceae bacterium]